MTENNNNPKLTEESIERFCKPVLNYKSPIEIFYHNTLTKLAESVDGLVVEGCISAGVDVNKEELVKALAYDREQYEKGYINGYKEGYKQALSDITGRFNAKFSEILEEVNTDVKTTTE